MTPMWRELGRAMRTRMAFWYLVGIWAGDPMARMRACPYDRGSAVVLESAFDDDQHLLCPGLN